MFKQTYFTNDSFKQSPEIHRILRDKFATVTDANNSPENSNTANNLNDIFIS